MNEKSLKKLTRYQLLELLISQTERADKLQARLDEMQKQMEAQKLELSTLGSIAEASLQLNGVFQAAQKAADLYVEAAKKHAEEIEIYARDGATEILMRAQAEASRIKKEG